MIAPLYDEMSGLDENKDVVFVKVSFTPITYLFSLFTYLYSRWMWTRTPRSPSAIRSCPCQPFYS